MTKKSSTTGKGFEYSLSNALLTDCFNGSLSLSDNAERLQLNDKKKYLSLSEKEQKYFASQSKKIAKFIESEYFLNADSLVLERVGDGYGTKGDPTDIQLKTNEMVLNISLKHNNLSLKHQRPASVYQQIKVNDKAGESDYRSRVKQISNDFFRSAKSIDRNIRLFKEVKQADNNLIDEELYRLITHEYFQVLSQYAQVREVVQNFFYFLVGNVNYIQITMSENLIKIAKFNDIDAPDSMEFSRISDSTFDLKFNNDFVFNLRLHTASSRIENCENNCCSLKFDTKCSQMSIPSETL